MKYLHWISKEGLGPVFVTFSGNLTHATVVRAMCLSPSDIRSAGFIARTSTGFYCHGHSESLGVASLVGDSKLAEAFFK